MSMSGLKKVFPKARVFLGCALLLAISVRAETWTNRAGHVIQATALSINENQLLMQDAKGKRFHIRLTSLAPADQQRAARLLKPADLPVEIKAPLAQAQQDIERAAQFMHGGKISAEQYNAQCRKIKERFHTLATEALKIRSQSADHTSLVRSLGVELDKAQETARTTPPTRSP
jgi:hypothetical protein